MTDVPKNGADLVSKRNVALIAAVSSVAVAFVSGLVSYIVSSATVGVELKKLESQDTLARAEMFQELVQKVQTDDGSSYALLALWKIYPQDKRLIVITALQNPTVQTLSTLQALGFAKELKDYEETIKTIMLNATDEQRKQYTRLFLDVSPTSVMETVAEAVIKSSDHRHLNKPALELIHLLELKPQLSNILLKHIAENERITKNMRLRVTFALVLYASGDKRAIATLFDEVKDDVDTFSLMASEFGPDEIETLITPSDSKRLLDLTINFLRKISDSQPKEHYFNEGIDLIDRLESKVNVSSEYQRQLAQMIIKVYLKQAKKRMPPIIVLKRLIKYAPKRAKELYMTTLACKKGEDAEKFFQIFDASELALDGWDTAMTYEKASSEARKHAAKSNDRCLSW